MKIQNRLQNLNESLYNIFIGNIEKVRVLLEKATPYEYTFHGIEHAQQLETYAENMLSDEIINSFTEDEIFILLHGIYYHDIGMIKYCRESVVEYVKQKDSELAEKLDKLISENPSLKESTDILRVNREEHNVLSARMIYPSVYEYDARIISLPNEKYAKSIAQLCLGHRDYKIGVNKVYTLQEIDKIEPYPKGEVHTLFLSCIVRLADELDITYQRAKSDILIHIKNILPERSLTEWVNHDLISMVKIDSKYHKIFFHPNKDFILKLDKEIGDRQITRNAIFSKQEKVQSELDELYKHFYVNASEPYKLGFSKVEIEYDTIACTEKDYSNYLEFKKKNEKRLMLENDINPIAATDNSEMSHKSESANSDNTNEREISLKAKINELNKIVKELYNADKLISLGNFILPSGYYTRYYFNTNIILPQSKILNLITDIFLSKFEDSVIDCVIGIDKAGQIIAPNLSLKLQCNYTYLVHNSEEKYSISFEKGCSINTAERIVIATDVISTGATLRMAIDKLKEVFSPQKIYISCIFTSNKPVCKLISEIENVELFYLNDEYSFKTYSPKELEEDEELRNEFNILKSVKK